MPSYFGDRRRGADDALKVDVVAFLNVRVAQIAAQPKCDLRYICVCGREMEEEKKSREELSTDEDIRRDKHTKDNVIRSFIYSASLHNKSL